jgi:hypothetical protein
MRINEEVFYFFQLKVEFRVKEVGLINKVGLSFL